MDIAKSLQVLAEISTTPTFKVRPPRYLITAEMSTTATKDDEKKRDWLGVEGSDAEEDAGSEPEEEEEESRVKGISRSAKRRKVDHIASADEDEDSDNEEDKEVEGVAVGEKLPQKKGDKGKSKSRSKSKSKDNDENDDLLFTNPNKLKPLTQDELAASKLATSKTGVIYLSRIPVCPPRLHIAPAIANPAA